MTFDNNQNLLNKPIAFQEASNKYEFYDFLKKSLEEYKDRGK